MTPVDPNTLDLRMLNKLLDQAKATVFLHSETAAFLGSIMSALEFTWTREIPTAATNGIHLWWNPEWFLSLEKKPREVVLRHELWHVARLHMVRQGARDPQVWNIACDYIINNDLKAEGCDFAFGGLVDTKYQNMAEEAVYDDLMSQPPAPDFGAWAPGSGADMFPMNQKEKQQVVNTVVTAIQQAKMAGGAGSVPGSIREMVEQYLTPVVPWQTILSRWCTQLLDEDYSWSKPNRRYDDMYLPSRRNDGGRLENLAWYIDVSGSIRMSHAVRFKSELKFVKDTFRPQKLTVVQFDTAIQQTDVWEEDDEFDKLSIYGRGGTSLECVRRHILEERPTAAIIFSDMECSPMSQEGIEDIPVLWVMLPSKRGHQPTFGESLTIQE